MMCRPYGMATMSSMIFCCAGVGVQSWVQRNSALSSAEVALLDCNCIGWRASPGSKRVTCREGSLSVSRFSSWAANLALLRRCLFV